MKTSDNQRHERQEDIVIFEILKASECSECGEELWKGSFLRMENDKPLCLSCADLDHLEFLPRGDAALTRRSRKYSSLAAVVVRFSRARGRYERQGLLVEPTAVKRAEKECLSDEEQRRVAREKSMVLRERAEEHYIKQFAQRIRSLYPGCPPDEAEAIATHTCEKYSGRIGRSADAKRLDDEAVDLAVKAHVRHMHTEYDLLLARAWERAEARAAIAEKVARVIDRWR